MSTWISLFINTPDKGKVVDKLKSFTGISVSTESIFPDDHYESFLLDESLPDYLIIGLVQADWVRVVYNSKCKLTDWCTAISGQLGTKVIVTHAQSVSDYYYFAYYDRGEKLRELEFCYSTDFEEVDFGSRFAFENERPGTRSEFDGQVSYLFDFESIEEYCKYFGIEVEAEHDQVAWTILKGTTKGVTMKGDTGGGKKPWWKVW